MAGWRRGRRETKTRTYSNTKIRFVFAFDRKMRGRMEGYGEGGNACNLIQETFNSVEKACKCYTIWSQNNWSQDCQIQEIADEKFACIKNVSSSCLLAVKNFAEAFSTANIANDPKFMCDDLPLYDRRDQIRDYLYQQEIWKSCAPGSSKSYFEM